MKPLFPDIETTITIKLGNALARPNQRHNRREQINQDDRDNEPGAFTQFLQIRKSRYSNHRNFRKDLAMFYLCLVSTVHNLFSIQLNAKCYPFLLTNETLNLLSSRKRSSSPRSNLVIISKWINCNSLMEQQLLIHFRKPTKLQKQNDSSPEIGLITLTKCITKKSPRLTLLQWTL